MSLGLLVSLVEQGRPGGAVEVQQVWHIPGVIPVPLKVRCRHCRGLTFERSFPPGGGFVALGFRDSGRICRKDRYTAYMNFGRCSKVSTQEGIRKDNLIAERQDRNGLKAPFTRIM